MLVLQPVDLSRSSGVALVEVSNRGGKFSPSYYNRAAKGRALLPMCSAAQKKATGDPRPALEEKYKGEADFLEQVERAENALVSQGVLLPEDVTYVLGKAKKRWAWNYR